MAEFVDSICLVASTPYVVGYETKAVSRLNDFWDDINEAPKAYRNILVELFLLLNCFDQTRQQAELGNIDQATQDTLLPVVDCYHTQVIFTTF
jgi:hypothetical protein